MNVGQIREYVRTQLDVDSEEYPNALLDSYLDEAFTRTVALEPRWPTYEYAWTVTKLDGETTITPPADLNISGIDSLINQETGRRLLEIGPETAEDYLLQNFAFPGVAWFTTYGGLITLWPQHEDEGEVVFTLRGQRMPAELTFADSDVPDLDVRLHRPLCNFIIALMYANQEDEVLEDTYMKRWQAGFVAARRSIFAPRGSRPHVLNGGLRSQYWPVAGEPAVVWDI